MPKKQITSFIGIDYGSKLAGTTAVCYAQGSELKIIQSEKKRDADQFVLDFCQNFKPELVFIDAPLSLPKAYFEEQAHDYFYRAADRETQAMSPMFIGGLTARAIQLKVNLAKQACEVMETYPKKLVQELQLTGHYKKDLLQFRKSLQQYCPLQFPLFETWHQADSALAYLSAFRYVNEACRVFGDMKEGQIFV